MHADARRHRRAMGPEALLRRVLTTVVLTLLAAGSVAAGMWVGRATQPARPAATPAARAPAATPVVVDAGEAPSAVTPSGVREPDGSAAAAARATEVAAASGASAASGSAAVLGSAAARTEVPAPESAAGVDPDTAAQLAALEFSPAARITGRIPRGGTLSASLRGRGVPAATVERIVREVGALFDFRYSRPGDRYVLVRDPGGRILEFRYEYSPVESVLMRRAGDAFLVTREEVELQTRPSRVAGVISTSLYDAVRDLGESAQLAAEFVDVFAWDIDFSRVVQRGDEFGFLYERFYREKEGVEHLVRTGRILAARYSGAAGTHAAVWFETEPGRGGYYRPDGSAVQRQFLAAPLEYSRISSHYTKSRRHPILKITRPHHGIDYAAPTGTPVWSVADGVVTYRGWAGGFGRLVKIRHPNGYESLYAHLSRFGGGVQVGQRVTQKKIIGYVGASGLATGPHVCFRIAKDGRYVNPATLRTPAGPPVPDARRAEFEAVSASLLEALEAAPSRLATLEAL